MSETHTSITSWKKVYASTHPRPQKGYKWDMGNAQATCRLSLSEWVSHMARLQPELPAWFCAEVNRLADLCFSYQGLVFPKPIPCLLQTASTGSARAPTHSLGFSILLPQLLTTTSIQRSKLLPGCRLLAPNPAVAALLSCK